MFYDLYYLCELPYPHSISTHAILCKNAVSWCPGLVLAYIRSVGSDPRDEVPSFAELALPCWLGCQVHTTSCDFHLCSRIVFDVMLILERVHYRGTCNVNQPRSSSGGCRIILVEPTSHGFRPPEDAMQASIPPKLQVIGLGALCLQFWTLAVCYLLDT